jgi:hypothetical protein
MDFLQFIRDFFNNYQLETAIGVFVFLCFYFNNKNQQNYEKLLSDKENLRIRYHEEKHELNNPSDVELMFGDLDNMETEKDLAKRYDNLIKETQANFDSKTLLNIETAIFVLLLSVLLITIYTFKTL